MLLAFFGGLYSNSPALEAAIADARGRGAERLFCLGDLGAFGPHPDRVFPLLHDHRVECVQGNYDHSIGHDLHDCQCGYTDPRDNDFAQLSYDYTYEHTSPAHRAWLRELPPEIRFEIDGVRFLLCHGSPRKTNEFLWESTTSTPFLEKLARDFNADVILGTHTGIHWSRDLHREDGVLRGGRRETTAAVAERTSKPVGPLAPAPRPSAFINVGVLGRPENDGRTNVWYTLVRTGQDAGQGGPVDVEFVPLAYDHERLARDMRDEGLPAEFIETILTGWWTTCLEVLPSKERRRGRH